MKPLSRITRSTVVLMLAALLAALLLQDNRALLERVFARKAVVSLEVGTPIVANDSDNVLVVSLPIFNRGDGMATEVQITAISLGSAPRLSPFSLPVVLGDIAAGSSSVIAAGFNSADLQVARVRNPRTYPLTVQGYYRSGVGVLDFTLSREIAIRPGPPIRQVINRTDANVASRGEVLNISDVVQLELSESPARPLTRVSLEQVASVAETHFFQESRRSEGGLAVAAETFVRISASQPVAGSMGICVRVPAEVLKAVKPGLKPELYVFVAQQTETEDSGDYLPLDATFNAQTGELIAPLPGDFFYPAEPPDPQSASFASPSDSSGPVSATLQISVRRISEQNPPATATFSSPSSNPVEADVTGEIELVGDIEFQLPVALVSPTDHGGMHDPMVNDGDTRFSAHHTGLDLFSGDGDPIYAAAAGTVTEVSFQVLEGHPRCNPDVQRGGGQIVRIRHEGDRVTSYAHLLEGSVLVRPGQSVSARQQIARAGHSGGVCPAGPEGAHLHFSYRINGAPVDPLPYFQMAPPQFGPQQAEQLMSQQWLNQLSVFTGINGVRIDATVRQVTQQRFRYEAKAKLSNMPVPNLIPGREYPLTVHLQTGIQQPIQLHRWLLKVISSTLGRCHVFLVPTTKDYEAKGTPEAVIGKFRDSIQVLTSERCAWQAEQLSDFVIIDPSTRQGVGPGELKFGVRPNTETVVKSGAIKVNDVVFTATQKAACNYGLDPTSESVGSGAGKSSFRVFTQSGCDWEALKSNNWLKITRGARGTGPGTVEFEYTSNLGTSPRTGIFLVAGNERFTLTQPPICIYTLNPQTASVGSGAGSGSFSVNVASDCPWTASSSATWLTIQSASGNGNGSVIFNYAANSGSNQRTATITVGGKPFTVTQAAACSYSLNPTTATVGSGAGGGSFSVSTQSSCAWMATSNATWLTITSGGNGTGNGALVFNYAANNTASARTGMISVADKSFTLTQTPSCTYSITPEASNAGSGAGGGSVNVTAPVGCTWTATRSVGWLMIVSGNSGSGNGSVVFNYSANPDLTSRIATIAVAGKTFTLTQAAACNYSLNPTTASVGNGAGGGSVSVTTASGCTWTATSSASWLTIVSGSSGSSNGSIVFNYSANPDSSTRTANITVMGKTFTLTQAAACSYTLNPTTASVGNGAGGGSVNVTAASGCSWTASSSTSWLTIVSGSSGTGNGSIVFNYSANSQPSTRTATISAGGKTFTLTQAAACTYSLSSTSASVGNGVGAGSFSVSAPSGCSWTARSSASWLSVTSGGSGGSGNGTVGYAYFTNSDPTSRTATITVADKSFMVTQAAACNYSLNPTTASVGNGAGGGSVSVSVASGCSWTASSNASWLFITSGFSGSGNGSVVFNYSANSQPYSRNATITVGGKTFMLTQAAACSYSLSPTSTSVGNGFGTGSFNVSVASGCSWTATTTASWLSVNTGSGNGNGYVSFTHSSNSQSTTRTATINVGDKAFTVTQAAACNYSLTPSSSSVGSGAGGGSVSVSAPSGCAWSASSSASWLTLPYGSSGSGNGSVTFNYSANNQTSPRTATIRIADKTFTLTQAALVCAYFLSPANVSVGNSVGASTFYVSVQSGCAWTAASSAGWLSIPNVPYGNGSGNGSGSVAYAYAPNSQSSPRTATITVGTQTFTVTQAAACSYSITPTSSSVGSGAGGGSVSVYTSSGCSWTATSNSTWLTLPFGSSGSGYGSVTFNYGSNTSSSSRSATITIAGKTFTLTQAGR